MADERELALQKMMEAADQDPQMRARLLQEPEAFAGKFQVKLAPEEIEQFKRLGQLTDLIDQLKHPGIPGPIFYPIDIWVREELGAYLVSRPLYKKFPIPRYRGYPIDMLNIREILVDRLITERFGAMRRR